MNNAYKSGTCSRSLILYCTAAAALVPALASPAGAADIQRSVAASLGYYASDAQSRHYSISEPWRSLTGQMICVRLDLPDGRGGYAPTTGYSMFQFDDSGRIVAIVKDNTLFGCPNRSYSALSPAIR